MLTFLTILACLPEFPNRTTEYLENPDADYDQDGYTENQGDCNDDDPTTFPDADELCDGVDNDCNGLLDDDPVDAKPFYLDADNDGVGQVNFTVTECEAPNGYIDLVFDEDGEILDDCDDDDRFVNPLAVEFCDGKDNDCDRDIDDADDDLQGNAFWYRDSDGDTFPSNEERREECSQPNGFVQGEETLPTALIDCNDSDASINPGANEVCDQVDNDCDGLVDDADTEEVMDHLWTVDADGDGFGSATAGADTQASCEPIAGYARLATDCDDNNFAIHPDAEEVCDYIDQNCNGQVDEGQGVKIPWYLDEDGDGFGADPSVMSPIEDCPQANPAGYVLNADDCDDGNGSTHPDADEYCDGVDNNCDLLVDDNTAVDATTWYLDYDGDGYGSNLNAIIQCNQPATYVTSNTDCDDFRNDVHPSMLEDCLTVVDDNCDGTVNTEDALNCSIFYEDLDGDNAGSANSLCACAPIGDFQATNDTDCDDSNSAIYPTQTETCSTPYDDNCNGDANDIWSIGCTFYYYDYDLDEVGTADSLCICQEDGLYTAVDDGDCDDFNPFMNPNQPEICDVNDTDENCDGLADDATAIGAVDWFRDNDVDGFGDDLVSLTQCDAPSGFILESGDCDDGLNLVNPDAVETCFTQDDDDCTGTNNDDGAVGCTVYYNDADGDGYGNGSDSQCLCYPEGTYTSVVNTDCDDTLASISPGNQETCDTPFDEDCDGNVDEVDAINCDVFHYDYDGDTYGLGSDSLCLCDVDGYYRAIQGGDCDDTDLNLKPDPDPFLSTCGLYGEIDESQSTYGWDVRASYTVSYTVELDYNNDGLQDLLVMDSSYDTDYTDAGMVAVFLSPLDSNTNPQDLLSGDVVFTIEQANTGMEGIWTGNVDGDPEEEFIVRTANAGSYLLDNGLAGMGVLNQDSAGVTSFGIPSGGAQWVDINQDGFVDMFAVSTTTTTIRYGSSGTPLLSSEFVNSWFVDQILPIRSSSLQDIDNDGDLDIVGQEAQASYSLWRYWENTPTGFVALETNAEDLHRIHFADLNNDGTKEIIANRKTTSIQYGTYEARCVIMDRVSGTIWSGDVDTICAAGDYNGDGFQDLVLLDLSTAQAGTFFNQSGEVFSLDLNLADVEFTFNTYRFDFLDKNDLSIDLDGDALQDINFGFQYWRSLGDGTFSKVYGLHLEGYEPTDLNGDGIKEIFQKDSGLKVYLNGSWQYTGCNNDSVIIQDFNDDGYSDILCTKRYLGSEVYFFEGGPNFDTVSDVSFSRPYMTSGSISTAFGIQVVDLDGDGVSEWIWGNSSSNSAIVGSTHGSSTFVYSEPLNNNRTYVEYTDVVYQKDLDNDGIQEVFQQTSTDFIITNIVDGQSLSIPLMGMVIGHLGLLWKDINGDGIEDCIGTLQYGTNGSYRSLQGFMILGGAFPSYTDVQWFHFPYNPYTLYQGFSYSVEDLDNDGYYEWHVSTQTIGTTKYQLFELTNSNVIDNGQQSIVSTQFDIDGDGIFDRINHFAFDTVNDPFLGLLTNAGFVEIVFSSDPGQSWRLEGNQGSRLGGFVATADVNNDNEADLLVPYDSGTLLFYGPLTIPTDSNGNPRTVKISDANATFTGDLILWADQNNDGFDDIWLYEYPNISVYLGAPN